MLNLNFDVYINIYKILAEKKTFKFVVEFLKEVKNGKKNPGDPSILSSVYCIQLYERL